MNSQQSWVRLPFSEPVWEMGRIPSFSPLREVEGGAWRVGWGKGPPWGPWGGAGREPAISLCPAPLSPLPPPPASKHLHFLFDFFSAPF